ncbi:16S rRNA processing protein RimM [Chitinispirillum alkaliphilum]|nr:16S rRNA processing protein RimM [Chitinispirillum alkaliphilum]
MSQQELIIIGVIRRAVGLEGFVAVQPTGSTFAMIQTPCKVHIGSDEQSADKTEIEQIRKQPKGFICKFASANDRDASERLNGKLLFVSKECLPRLEEGDYYHFQLQGLEVYADSNGKLVGKVRDVVSLPTMDALEVVLVKGGSVLVPYNDQAVVSVDTESGRITLRWSFIEEMI